MLSFIKSFIGVKADQAVNAGITALVNLDPKGATEAELRTMEQHLDELGRQVAEARQSFNKEQKEADAIQKLHNQRMAAAENLQQQLDAETDPNRRDELEKSLGTIVGMLEEMNSDVDREIQEAAEAKEFLEMLEGTYNDAGKKLKSARGDLEKAQRDMARADQQRQAADRRAETARQAAGLASSTSGLNVALKAMQDSAAKSLVSAESANAKAKLLTPSMPEKDDPNIAAAMAAASGKPVNTSLSDRLSALKKR